MDHTFYIILKELRTKVYPEEEADILILDDLCHFKRRSSFEYLGSHPNSLKNREVRHLMSDEWKNKRKIYPFWPFEELQKYINEIIQEALEQQNKVRPHVYILLIRDYPNLETIANGRGNLNQQQISNRVTEEQKTLIDVFDEKNISCCS